jgi:4,5-DOPA dioxygenase extradiol
MGKMPTLFVGHGSPMNAIEDNEYTQKWKEIGATIPRPEAILVISAHWTTEGVSVSDSLHPRTVYDMFGFPKALYEVVYQPSGSPEHAHMAAALLKNVRIDNSWGIDHGSWSVLRWMFPDADVPVFQVSLDGNASRQTHFEMGQALKPLRERKVLIIGSGNIVHNLSRVNWDMDGGYPWADEFDNYIKDRIENRQFNDVIDYASAGQSALAAFRTTEHYDPLLYVLGASDAGDQLTIVNDSCTKGSISMTSYLYE